MPEDLEGYGNTNKSFSGLFKKDNIEKPKIKKENEEYYIYKVSPNGQVLKFKKDIINGKDVLMPDDFEEYAKSYKFEADGVIPGIGYISDGIN